MSAPDEPAERGWWAKLGVSLGEQVMGAVVVAVVLSITALVFNDFILPPPDLNGGWKFTELTEASTRPSIEGLKITYKVLLIQDGLSVSGSGEKVSQQYAGRETEIYTSKQKKKMGIEVSGHIKHKFFSRDELVLHIKNEGARRATGTLHEVEHFSKDMMSGCFKTTAASASGPVRWERIDWRRKGHHVPLEISGTCSE